MTSTTGRETNHKDVVLTENNNNEMMKQPLLLFDDRQNNSDDDTTNTIGNHVGGGKNSNSNSNSNTATSINSTNIKSETEDPTILQNNSDRNRSNRLRLAITLGLWIWPPLVWCYYDGINWSYGYYAALAWILSLMGTLTLLGILLWKEGLKHPHQSSPENNMVRSENGTSTPCSCFIRLFHLHHGDIVLPAVMWIVVLPCVGGKEGILFGMLGEISIVVAGSVVYLFYRLLKMILHYCDCFSNLENNYEQELDAKQADDEAELEAQLERFRYEFRGEDDVDQQGQARRKLNEKLQRNFIVVVVILCFWAVFWLCLMML